MNFFQPVRKLVQKERIGSKIKKRYDVAQTPYRRVLASTLVSEEIKMKLKREYDMLNPAKLKREITRLQNQLFGVKILQTVSSTFLLEAAYQLSSTFLREAIGKVRK